MMNVKLREQADLAVQAHDMKENETRYIVKDLTTCYVVYKCVKCGKLHVSYCAEPDWNYCEKCGRKIIKGDDDNGNGSVNKSDGNT